MPIVTSSPWAATSAASRTHAAKAAWSVITWSAANEAMSASGSSSSSWAAASPMAAMESRGDGSAITRSTSGSWLRTASSWATPVTTSTRSPTSGARRSTVAWIRVRPLSVRSRRNLGLPARESGHSRVPAPPAGTTAQSRSTGAASDGVMAGILSSGRPGGGGTSLLWMIHASTFPDLLAQRLQSDPGQPFLTAYDESTGERTELSVTTYANWVSKTANLLTDELGLDAGDTVLLDLPPHWLVPVFLGAAWSAGLSVTQTRQARHAVAVCGPDSVDDHDGCRACRRLLDAAVRGAVRRPAPQWGARLRVAVARAERCLHRPDPTEPGHGRVGLPRASADPVGPARGGRRHRSAERRAPAHRRPPGIRERSSRVPGADGARRLGRPAPESE